MRSVRSWSAHLTAWRDRMPPRSLLGPRASPGSSVWVNRFPVRSEDQLMSNQGPTGPGFAVPIMLEPKHSTWFGALAWRDAKAGESASARSAMSRPGRPPSTPLVACWVPYIKHARARVCVARRVRCSESTGTRKPYRKEHLEPA